MLFQFGLLAAGLFLAPLLPLRFEFLRQLAMGIFLLGELPLPFGELLLLLGQLFFNFNFLLSGLFELLLPLLLLNRYRRLGVLLDCFRLDGNERGLG